MYHIALPFSLVKEDGMPRNPTYEEFNILGSLFPTHFGTAVIGPFLAVKLEVLPPRPWPLTVAGLPLFLTTKNAIIPWDIGAPGNLRYRVLEEIDARDGYTEDLYDEIGRTINCGLLPGYVQKTAMFYHTDVTSAEEHIDQHTEPCEDTKGIRDPFEIRLFDRLTMDLPSIGQLEGQFLAAAKKRVPCEGPTGYQWVEQLWCWFGQEAIDIEKCRGAPLRDDEGHIVGFLRCLNSSNFGVGDAA